MILYSRVVNINDNKLCITSYDILSIQSVGPAVLAALSIENIGETYIKNSDNTNLNLNNTISNLYYNRSNSKWEVYQSQMV